MRVTRFSPDSSFSSTTPRTLNDDEEAWEVDSKLFNVYLAVPEDDDDIKDQKFIEHVYTISAEDLKLANNAINPEELEEKDVENRRKTGTSPLVGRRQFRKCHSSCVQSTCLPVQDVNKYTSCNNNCKSSCQ